MLTLCAGGALSVQLTGCGSTPQRVTYVAAGVTVTGADAAMTLWGAYVAKYHPPVAQEIAVKAAYEKYQVCMFGLIDTMQTYVALTAVNSTNAPPVLNAVTAAQIAATQALADLLALLKQFGVKV